MHAVVDAQFVELRPVRARFLGSGWDNDAFLVNGAWVFRFPRRRDAVTGLQREIAAAPGIARILEPLGVTTPRPEKLGRPGQNFPYPFAGHRLVPGVAGDAVPLERLDLAPLAARLGDALSALHTGSLPGVALPADPPSWISESLRKAVPEVRAALPADLRKCCEPWLEGRVPPPPPYTGPQRLLHNDLCPDHVLVDEPNGRLRGLIDFADIALGDPVSDLVVFYCWLGRPFVTQLLRHYTPSVDSGLWPRLEFHARALSLLWLGEARQQRAHAQLPKHVAWIRNAFELD